MKKYSVRVRMSRDAETAPSLSLNAPSGAGCFLTSCMSKLQLTRRSCLNAPSDAGCFLT